MKREKDWKVVIPNDGINFGFAQKLNVLRPISPCCGDWINYESGLCETCGDQLRNHPNAGSWVIGEEVSLWSEFDQPENWISALTGIPAKHLVVTVDDTRRWD